jgi:hypothetical protein
MSDETPFPELIERVRGGDGDAATELVQRYEPAIRRVVRLRLTDPRLRRAFDSMDVCQSVLASFWPWQTRSGAGGRALRRRLRTTSNGSQCCGPIPKWSWT